MTTFPCEQFAINCVYEQMSRAKMNTILLIDPNNPKRNISQEPEQVPHTNKVKLVVNTLGALRSMKRSGKQVMSNVLLWNTFKITKTTTVDPKT